MARIDDYVAAFNRGVSAKSQIHELLHQLTELVAKGWEERGWHPEEGSLPKMKEMDPAITEKLEVAVKILASARKNMEEAWLELNGQQKAALQSPDKV